MAQEETQAQTPPATDGEDDQPTAQTHAENIRAAVANLNELVGMAAEDDISVEYTIQEINVRHIMDKPRPDHPVIHVKVRRNL